MKSMQEVIEFINSLDSYSGYVQFSHRPIDKTKDIFIDKSPKINNENGFIYEAHFCNGKESISIKQINNEFLVSSCDISNIKEDDIQSYISDIEGFDYKIKMVQIWEAKVDDLCEGLKVHNLKSVVFAGFEKGENK